MASCDTMSSKFSSPTVARQHRYDSSDDESFPDVEELYRRRLANKTEPSSDASTSEELHILQTPVDTGVTHKDDASQVYLDPQISDHAQAQTEIHACHSEDLTGPKGVSNEDTQKIQAKGLTNVLSSSKSKKRSRHRSKSKSKSRSDISEVDFIGGIALPESREATSPCDTRSVKRRKGPGHAPKTHNMADQSKLGLGLHFSTASTPRENAANDIALGSSNDNPVGKSKGEANPPHTQDDHHTSAPKLLNEDSHTPKPPTPFAPPAIPREAKRRQRGRKRPGLEKRRRKRRYEPRQQPDCPRGKHMGNRQGPREFDRYNQSRRDVKRATREKTTDTVDFGKFDDDDKLDTLWRKLSRMEEVVKKIEKKD